MRRCALLVICALGLFGSCRDRDDAAAKPAPEKKTDADGDGPGVTISKEAQLRGGIRTESLALHRLQPELLAYGRLEEDPSSSFVVRAAFAGILHSSAGLPWPSLGQTLPDGTAFGRIEPRLSVTDRISLNTQLASARADLNAATAAVAASQIAYDRARALNADNKNISDRAVQEAAAKLAMDQAHQAGARALIEALDSAGKSGTQAVVAERGGEVAEVPAQPGESIEQGSPILRLARYDRMLARIDFPMGQPLPAGGAATIVPAGFEDQHPLQAERIGAASNSDPHTQGVSLLYKLNGTLPGLRPGMAVTAHFLLPGKAGEGVTIPHSAFVQQDGRSWAYVQTKEDRFSRRPVSSDGTARGFSAGDRIVVTGAQTLLSEEFKSQNEADTN